jgi:hypothetical protein
MGSGTSEAGGWSHDAQSDYTVCRLGRTCFRKALRSHIGDVGVVRAFQIALPAIRAPTTKINVAR